MKLFAVLIAGFLIAAATIYFWPKPKLAEGAPVREFVIELIETESHPISEDTISAQVKMIRLRLHDAKITNEVLPAPDSHQILIRLNDAGPFRLPPEREEEAGKAADAPADGEG